MSDTNGNGEASARVVDILESESTVGYVPTMPLEGMWSGDGTFPNVTLRRDIEFMQFHPVVSIALEYYKSGIAGAEFWGGPDHRDPTNDRGKPISADPKVAEFVMAHCERFWNRGVPLLQDGAYPYGWGPGEHIYREVSGYLTWSHMKDFHPNDAFVLTLGYQPVGIRVKNVRGKEPVDLWFGEGAVPAKAAWYAHHARFNRFYGRTQLTGAWLPWRRLGWRDGVEQVIDAAIYRAGYKGPVVKHPPEDMQTAMQGVPATRVDGQGNPRRSARDVARQMVEWAKAGAGFTMSSAQYPPAQGGGPKWVLEWPDHVMDVRPLIEGAAHLEDQILLGIGVPPELVKAGGTGSGYSGRSIPREAFLAGQQKVADAILQMFVEQVVKPLVMMNFGDVPFSICCKSLLKTQADDKQGEDKKGGAKEGAAPDKAGAGGPSPSPPPQPGASPPESAPMSVVAQQREKVLAIVRRVLGGASSESSIPDKSIPLSESIYHGPSAPGPGWEPAGEGPRGGKLWRHKGAAPGLWGRVAGKVAGRGSADSAPQAGHTTAEHLAARMASSKAYRATVQKLDEKDRFLYEQLAYHVGKTTPEGLKAQVAEKAQKLADSCDVYMRVPEDVFPKILQSGRFLNQFEAGASKGIFAPKMRTKVETDGMGTPPDAAPPARPISAYLEKKGFAGAGAHKADPYGKVAVRFKQHIRQRSTVTFGDSLSVISRGVAVATPLSKVGHQSVDVRDIQATNGTDMLDSIDDYNNKIGSYIEVQVHDGLTLDDVEEVGFPETPDMATQQALVARGIKWQVYK